MKKSVILVIIITCMAFYCKAQGFLGSDEDNAPATTQLFHLNEEQYNHHFNYSLPDDGILNIDFLRLSDWGEKNDLSDITRIAAKQVALLKDSFTSAVSTKTIELNIPIDKQIISVNYKEDNSKKNQLAFKDNSYYQLKSGFDTIRIIKNMGVRTKPAIDSGVIQIQYTFILKDIQKLVENHEAIKGIGDKTDSVIYRQRQKWNRQDAVQHQLSLTYDPKKSEDILKNKTYNSTFPFIRKYIGVYIGIGAIVYENSISPYLDESIAYLVPSTGKTQGFVGLNITVFGLLNGKSTFFTNRNYSTINAEFGFCKKSRGLMQQKSSMVLGLMMHYEDGQRNNMFHMGFNYGFNSFLSAGFSVASDFKKDSNNNFMGVHFKFNL